MRSITGPSSSSEALARWLLEVLSPQHPSATEVEAEVSEAHLHLYRQLPDFIETLLKQERPSAMRFAPLIFHLASCRRCHEHYLELYDAMQAALDPPDTPLLLPGTATQVIVPERMIGQLCQLLISQAEASGSSIPSDSGASIEAARSYLQLAITLSATLSQNHIRREATTDLVRVALQLADRPAEGETSTLYGTALEVGGGLRGLPVYRYPLVQGNIEQEALRLHSATFEGSIVQRGHHLILNVDNLDAALRGKQVIVSIPLGTLIEPIRWLGGNPLSLRSSAPVDVEGLLIMPLGETDLRLSNIEERRVLEVLFLRLEIRAVPEGI